MPINLTDFIIRKPRVPLINLRTTLPPTSSGAYVVKNAFTIKYAGSGTTALMHITAKSITTIINGDRNHPDCINLNIASSTLANIQSFFSTLSNYTFVLQGNGLDRAYLQGLLNIDIKATVQVSYGIPAEYLIEAENTAKFGTATVRWIKDNFYFNSQKSTWLLNTGANYNQTGILVPGSVSSLTGSANITTAIFYNGAGANPANNKFNFSVNGTPYNITFAASPTGVSTSLSSIVTQINTQAPNVPSFASASGNYLKLSTQSYLAIGSGSANTVLGFNALLAPGQVFLEDGISLDLTANIANQEFDLAKLKTVVDEILINSAGENVEFVTMSVLEYLVPGTLQIKYNDVLKTENVDYVVSTTDKRLNFLRSITGETHILVDPVLNFITVNTLGTSGILTDYVNVKRNGNPLIPNTDFLVPVSSIYQGKNVGNGTILFIKHYIDDPLADYVLTTEDVLYNQDLIIKKNGIQLQTSEYVVVLEAGFINLNTSLFPGDTLTATYRSVQYGQITNEILAGIPATVTSTATGPFHIIAGSNDTLITAGDGLLTETIILPVGSSVSLNDVISSYNLQAINTFMALDSTKTKLVISSKTPGTTSIVSVFNSSANSVLGFTPTTTTGKGAIGGEFAFDLQHAPIQINSFSAPELGNTFFIKENDVSSKYPPGTLIQINGDLYTTKAVSTVNRATLYNNPPTAQVVSSSAPDEYIPPYYPPVTYRISPDVNDTFIFAVDGITYNVTLTPNKNSYSLAALLNEPTVSLTGTVNISTITFYDGTGVKPANNLFSFIVDNNPINIFFTASATGIITSLESIIKQIGSYASSLNSRLVITGNSSVNIQNGSANILLGFSEGDSTIPADPGTEEVDKTSKDIVDDINFKLNLPPGIVMVETFIVNAQEPNNKIDYIKIQSPTVGVGGSVVIGVDSWKPNLSYPNGTLVEYRGNVYTSAANGNLNNKPGLSNSWILKGTYDEVGNGTANLMLGFQNKQTDIGLTDTKIVINGGFIQNYVNPILKSTHKAVTFLTETTSPEQSPANSTSINFNGFDLTSKYKKNTAIRLGLDIYFVVKSIYQEESNTTVISLAKPLRNPVFTTSVIEYTNRPIYMEGETNFILNNPPIIDDTHTVTLKNNGIPMSNNAYTVNSNGSITLASGITSDSNITADYYSITNFSAGDVITVDYRIFYSVVEGTQVKASYQYISPDKFFLDLIYQNSLSEGIYNTIQSQLSLIQNPSSSGFTSSAGGQVANDSGGNETPSLSEFKYRYLDDVAKKIYNFYDARIKNFTDERMFYNGMIPGAADGNVTETNMQDSVNPESRLFPMGYTKINPLRVPALDAINKKDDGSDTGGTDLSVAIVDLLNKELADINAEQILLTALLAIATAGTVTILGNVNITTVTFYNGAGANPANNVFNFTVDGTPITVTFTASAAGVSTSLSSIISQIGPKASVSGSKILLTGTLSISIQAGTANTVLGFVAGGAVANRNGSPEYAQWKALVADEIAKNTASIASKNSILAVYSDVLQEYVDIYTKAFDETKTNQTYLSGTFDSELQATLNKNNADYVMDINVDANINARHDVTNPARIIQINNELTILNQRLLQISNYFRGTFSQALVGSAVFTATYPLNLIFDGASTVDTIVNAWNNSNSGNTVSYTGITGTTILSAQTVSLIAKTGESLLDNRYSWLYYRTNRSDGTIQSIKRVLDNQTNNSVQVNVNNSLLNGLT